MLRYSIRELLLFMLVVAVGTGWLTESVKARQWRQRAEIAADHLLAEQLGRIVFGDKDVTYQSEHFHPPFRDVTYRMDELP